VNEREEDVFEALAHLGSWRPYQLVIMALCVWLVASLIPQIIILARAARDRTDWAVVFFRVGVASMAATIALHYLIDVSPWFIVIGFLVLAVASTQNATFIVSRARSVAPVMMRAEGDIGTLSSTKRCRSRCVCTRKGCCYKPRYKDQFGQCWVDEKNVRCGVENSFCDCGGCP
jgi:hypothetical protein